MAETNGATETLADSGTQPPAGDAKSQADSAGEQTQPESISLDEAKKLRSEAQALRKRLKDLEEVSMKTAEAQLSEHERALAQARRDGAKEERERVNALIRRSTVSSALAAAGANPDLLDLAYQDAHFGALAVNDDGDVAGVKEAVAAVQKARPSLFLKPAMTGSADGGPRGAAPAPDFNTQLRRAAGRA